MLNYSLFYILRAHARSCQNMCTFTVCCRLSIEIVIYIRLRESTSTLCICTVNPVYYTNSRTPWVLQWHVVWYTRACINILHIYIKQYVKVYHPNNLCCVHTLIFVCSFYAYTYMNIFIRRFYSTKWIN